MIEFVSFDAIKEMVNIKTDSIDDELHFIISMINDSYNKEIPAKVFNTYSQSKQSAIKNNAIKSVVYVLQNMAAINNIKVK